MILKCCCYSVTLISVYLNIFTVVLDAPTGMSSDVWALIQPQLTQLTTVNNSFFSYIESPSPSRSLVDRWGTTDYLATSSLHPLASQSSSWWRPASCQSIPGCCPPISSSVCLFFSLLVLCPAGLFWQALQILLRARTISVCVANLDHINQIQAN